MIARIPSIRRTVLALVASAAVASGANALEFAIDAGGTMPTGDRSDAWNSGFVIGTSFYLYPQFPPEIVIREKIPIAIGVRFSYDRWFADEDEFARRVFPEIDASPDMAFATEIDARASSIGIAPFIRALFPLGEGGDMLGFAHLGAGCYIFDLDADVRVTRLDTIREQRFGTTANRPGVTIGAGVMFSQRIEVYPLYTVVFTSDRANSQYLSVNLGVRFGDRVD